MLLHEAVAPSSAGDQLLILLPAWRAGPSPIPPTRVDPIFLRVQAPSRFSVGHIPALLADTSRGGQLDEVSPTVIPHLCKGPRVQPGCSLISGSGLVSEC
jgi:hypothetical protein